MMINKISIVLLLALSLIPVTASAIDEWVEKEGVIREIDLANRTAIISGFRYYFGTAGGYQAAEIQLLLYPTATFEMLSVDMKVQYHYTRDQPYRRILRLRQLADDAWMDNDELPDAILD